jgi:hypothetical protein
MKHTQYNADYLKALYIKLGTNPVADFELEKFASNAVIQQLDCENVDVTSVNLIDGYLSWLCVAHYKNNVVCPYIELRYYINGKQRGLCQLIVDLENQDDTFTVKDSSRGAVA